MHLIIIISVHLIVFSGQLDDFSKKNTFQQVLPIELASSTKPCTQKAKKELESDDWRAALETFKEDIENDNCFDTQIAFKLIKNIINNNSYKHYPFAEHIYNQSLSIKGDEKHRKIIQEEALKLFPLLSDEEKKEWEEKIENNDPTLSQNLKTFWTFQDPVLSTSNNERLAEHWQRIAHVRKEFNRNQESIYNTDDRGTIYVKYGPPSFKRSGILSPESTEIRSKLYDLSFFKGDISPRELFNLRMSIKQQYMPKYYEVWIYRNLGSRRPVLFIFGESANRGTFGLRKSVEEFISSGSFRMGISSSWSYGAGPRGITAGPFLQMALYNQLSTIDIYFGNQLAYYDDNWLRYMNGNLNFSSFRMLNNSSRAERELRRIQQQAPEAQSTLKKSLDYIDHYYKVFRFLNDQNEPVSRVLVFSSPDEKLIQNDALIYQHQDPIYKVEHAAKIFDENTEQIYSHKAESMRDKRFSVAKGTLLEIPESKSNISSDLHTLLISSEVSRIASARTTAFKPNQDSLNQQPVVIASTIDEVTNKASPLNPNKNVLEVSDVIWGYRPGKKNHDIENISFTIPKDSNIPSGKNLVVYFEAYHLKASPDNLDNFQIEYHINRIKRRRTIDTGIKLTLNFSSATSTAKETLEIKTADLKAGKYRAILRFSESLISVPFAERFIEFTIDK